MRYLLIILGLVCVIFGVSGISSRESGIGILFYIAGVISLPLGLATCDIVNAINPKPEIKNEEQNP
jgi:hypothetical protein